MNKMQKVNFAVFALFVVASIVVSNLMAMGVIEKPEKPLQMQFEIDEDVLTLEYKEAYSVLPKKRVADKYADSTRKTALILVDAWGVPFDIELIKKDFALFQSVPHQDFLHERIANRTRHAEFVEYRNALGGGTYLFGGDSLEYGRPLYFDSLGYSKAIFCQRCSDDVMLAKLDSALLLDESRVYALTTQNSRNGVREELRNTLHMIAELAQKHPDVRFIVQGTHRPTLGSPKIRREHFAKWVPVVVLN